MILLALGLAVAYCAPPGAVTAEAFRQAVRCGWRGALGIEIGSVVGDAAYGALALTGLRAVLQVGWAHGVVGVVGVVLLLYLAIQGFAQARRPRELTAEGGQGPRTFWSAFGLGAGLALANPMGIPFWLSFGGAALALHGRTLDPASLWVFFVSFVAGCLLWSVMVALVLTRVQARLSPRLVRAVSLAAAVALAGFGLAMGVSLLGV